MEPNDEDSLSRVTVAVFCPTCGGAGLVPDPSHIQPDIECEDCGLAAMELLDVMRTLTGRYEELVVDAGSHHAGAFGEFADDDEMVEEGPPRAKRPIGFAE